MSEYQYVHFLAIDRPLTDDGLKFMEKQSSRAEITRWEFTNEYNFGDFHGDAEGMLRHGYDIHLHYANFGIRKLMIRLPAGLPCDRQTFERFQTDAVTWKAEKRGKGGILEVYPEADAGTFDYLHDPDELLPEIAPVREQLIGGDLRALYILWLANCFDEEEIEPPVPAGLGKLTPALDAIAEFYELGEDLIAAAAQRSPPLPKATDAEKLLKDWIAGQSVDKLQEIVEQLLTGDAAAVRAETLSRVRDASGVAPWPMAEPTRTFGELLATAKEVGAKRTQREKKASEAKRRKRLAAIAADPEALIARVEQLVQYRSTENYEQAAEELADLREALGPDEGPARAKAVAAKLRAKNPTLKLLIRALKQRRLLD